MLSQHIPSYDAPALEQTPGRGQIAVPYGAISKAVLLSVKGARTNLFDTGVDGYFGQNSLTFGFVYMNYFDIVASRVR